MTYKFLPSTIRIHHFEDKYQPPSQATSIFRTFPILRVSKYINAEASPILLPKVCAEPLRLTLHSHMSSSFPSHYSVPNYAIEHATAVDHTSALIARRCGPGKQPEKQQSLTHFVDTWGRSARAIPLHRIWVIITFDTASSGLDKMNTCGYTIRNLAHTYGSSLPLNNMLSLKATAYVESLRGKLSMLKDHLESISSFGGGLNIQVGDVMGKTEWRADREVV